MEDIPAEIQKLQRAALEQKVRELELQSQHNKEVADQLMKDFQAACIERDKMELQNKELHKKLDSIMEGVCKECKGGGEIGLSDGEVPCPTCGGSGDVMHPGMYLAPSSYRMHQMKCPTLTSKDATCSCEPIVITRADLKPKDEERDTCIPKPTGRALQYCSEYQKTSHDHAASCTFFAEKRKGEEHGA